MWNRRPRPSLPRGPGDPQRTRLRSLHAPRRAPAASFVAASL